jgi:hypothetical protein
MITGEPGLGVTSLVRAVLAEDTQGRRSRMAASLEAILPRVYSLEPRFPVDDAYRRLFSTKIGTRAANAIGNESRTLDALSSLSVEVLFEYLSVSGEIATMAADGARFLVVPGATQDPPALLILDPRIESLSDSRRLTNVLVLHPAALVEAFASLRSHLLDYAPPPLRDVIATASNEDAVEMLLISQPEVVASRRPQMVPLCSPSPFVSIACGSKTSSVGVICHDADGDVGVTACYHGTGPAGTPAAIRGCPLVVKRDSVVQDTVFIPYKDAPGIPAPAGRSSVRSNPAPSEAEPVHFEGAGTRSRVDTHVQSHDPGVTRSRPELQLKVQTPPDTNNGDSGCALIDGNDRVAGFAFQRTGIGEYPEMTDWIWAANALAALGLTPL